MRHEVDLRKRDSDVIFNREMTHRYWLRRRLFGAAGAQPSALVCLFIMLNPSRADAFRSDNTVSRCIQFVQLWGFSQLWVANLFAYRSPYPGDLYEASDPIGDDNDDYIAMAVRQCDRVVIAWGNHGAHMERAQRVIDLIRWEGKEPMAFGLTQQRQPFHPLARGRSWIPYDTGLRTYEDLLIA